MIEPEKSTRNKQEFWLDISKDFGMSEFCMVLPHEFSSGIFFLWQQEGVQMILDFGTV